MRIPQYFSFRWWQLMLYEIALFSLGVSVTGIWQDIFIPYALTFLFIFVCITPYIIFIYLNQITRHQNTYPSQFDSEDNH